MPQEKPEGHAKKPMLEWVSAGIGLALTLAMLGFLGWKAIDTSEAVPPAVAIDTGAITRVGAGYVVEITATNESATTAAGVEVEGRIMREGRVLATSTVTFDYVPGRSSRHGGMFFEQDPAAGMLQARALGYSDP
ncbi:MAG: hypothetical protein H0W24_13045 [Lysobacter sp.]|nr:hypothetical protein [Lysobacter sp.]MDQ3206104.1 hypothetical protein [Pseudomonadota bacterium]